MPMCTSKIMNNYDVSIGCYIGTFYGDYDTLTIANLARPPVNVYITHP